LARGNGIFSFVSFYGEDELAKVKETYLILMKNFYSQWFDDKFVELGIL
jgi:hypothetical protein